MWNSKSATDDVATPQWILNKLKAEFGNKFHDPCPLHCPTDNYKEDFPTDRWTFVNPPFSAIGKWVRKAHEQWLRGCTVIVLAKNTSATKWFSRYVIGKAELRFFETRLQFIGYDKPAPFPCMLIVYRAREFHDKYSLFSK